MRIADNAKFAQKWEELQRELATVLDAAYVPFTNTGSEERFRYQEIMRNVKSIINRLETM